MNELQTKRLALLDETANHYNLTNRSYDGDHCLYSPSETSEGCAIGRKVADKELCKEFDRFRSLPEGSSVYNKDIKTRLPTELSELGVIFLADVQRFHDLAANWTKEGISDLGRETYKDIKHKINTIYYDFSN